MADVYYYTHDEKRMGPCSAREIRGLVASGDILRNDTIWKVGLDYGLAAGKILNLFPPASEDLAASNPAPAVREPVPEVAPPAAAAPPAELPKAADRPPVTSAYQTPVRKGRATAGKGAVIVGQDGVNVKFKKKCTTCGREDTSWNTLPIRSGISRALFYCLTCKKSRQVEIHGSLI